MAFVPFVDNEHDIPLNVVYNYFKILRHSIEFMDPDGNLVPICLDLARYESPELVTLSLQVINRHFTQMSDLFTKGEDARILTSPESITNFKLVNEHLPVLRRLILIELEDQHVKELGEILDQFIKLCSLADDPTEPNPTNQRIMLNASIIADIVDVLSKHVDMGLKDKFAGLINIRKKCFTFLEKFCRKHTQIQAILFEDFSELLNVKGAEKEMGLWIQEMFRENEELAMKIQETHIEKLVHLLSKHQIHEIWIAINAIIRIDYFPIKRNQNFAVKHLMQNRDKVILYTDKKDRAYRIGPVFPALFSFLSLLL